jgi:hypothetical protein
MTSDCKLGIDGINANALPALLITPAPAPSIALQPTGNTAGVDCAGSPTPAVPTVGSVQTIPHPTAIQLVKLCKPETTLDRDYSTLCAPDGTKVLIVTAWDTTAPLATAPAVEAYTLAGTIYTGDRALLANCAAEKLDIVSEVYCSGGKSYERVSFYSVNTSPPALVSTLWRDASGASVSAPAAGTVGKCIETCPPGVVNGVLGTWGTV